MSTPDPASQNPYQSPDGEPSTASSEGSTQGSAEGAGVPKRQLTLFDSTCIIIGIIIGAGIFETSPLIALFVPGVWALIGVWVAGGLISLVGALCYAELATAYPEEGGDYVYFNRAYGRSTGFLFAWAQFWVVRPGSIGAMAYVFARYANQLLPLSSGGDQFVSSVIYAVAAVAILTVINMVGVREGKWTQNLLTIGKVVGLAAICVVGLCFSSPGASLPPAPGPPANIGLAMIFVLFTYGGWNEMAYVGAELRNPKKNIFRGLVAGTIAVMVVYVVINVAFVHALGFGGTRGSDAVAAEVLGLGLGTWGARVISVLICVSALGAINGLIFTGARIYYAMGQDHRVFALLGRWSGRRGTPVWSLVVQGVVSVVLVVAFGLLTRGSKSGFQSMVEFTTPIFWMFFLLAGLSLFILRAKEPNTPRPYRVTGYPITPVLFCLSSVYMLYSSLSYAVQQGSTEPVWAVALMMIGVLLCFFDRAPGNRDTHATET